MEALTPDQQALLPRLRDEWLRIGLATGPADRPAAEEGVRRAYRAAGLGRPSQMLWLGSPLAGAIAASMLSVSEVSDRVPGGYWRAVRARLLGQLGASAWMQPSLGLSQPGEERAADRFGAPAGAPVQERISEPVRRAVLYELRDRLGGPAQASLTVVVEDSVRGPVWRELGGRLSELIRGAVEPVVEHFLAGADVDDEFDGEADWDLPRPPHAVFGQHDAHWLALGAALRAVAPGAVGTRVLDGLTQVARSAGWWWPFEHLVILTERPTTLRYDPQGRLHGADGPAASYPDGFAIWAWHGVSVPSHAIEQPEELTVQRIRDEPDPAVRQVMLERYGPERYLLRAGAERVSHDDTGALWRADLGGERLVMVEVRNSTPEPDGSYTTHWLRVPPEARTAREAVAWTFDLPADDYAPIVQT